MTMRERVKTLVAMGNLSHEVWLPLVRDSEEPWDYELPCGVRSTRFPVSQLMKSTEYLMFHLGNDPTKLRGAAP